MSRIGKLPVEFPADISVSVDGSIISFKRGKDERTLDLRGNATATVEGNLLKIARLSDSKEHGAFWGTYRALSANIVKGLIDGFERKLEINGVGYRAAVKGKVLNLQLGFSHDINYDIPDGVNVSVEKNIITLKGIDNQTLGQMAAEIRAFRPPEPYKGKGVKYLEEHIVRKAGKTAKK